MDGAGCLTPVRRSLDVDCLSLGSGSGSSSPSSSASSSLAASMLLLRPRAFARQLSDDLRRRRESYAAGQYGSSGGCYSPLATGAVGVPAHRHSVGGLQLLPGNLIQTARLHSAAAASCTTASAASAANGIIIDSVGAPIFLFRVARVSGWSGSILMEDSSSGDLIWTLNYIDRWPKELGWQESSSCSSIDWDGRTPDCIWLLLR